MHNLRSTALVPLLMGVGVSLAFVPIAAATTCPPVASRVAVGVSPPPPLPQESQPPIPAYGDVWTPGYWAWNGVVNDYYWTPGLWVQPPRIGFLWTPGYWGWNDGVYLFSAGYWGPSVGFYGGINYGFGYGGFGYRGGFWRGRTFLYNRAVNNLGNLRINAVYHQRLTDARRNNRISFNGGPGGVRARPTAQELAAGRGPHLAATPGQSAHGQAASLNGSLRSGVNHGRPPTGGPARPDHAGPAVSHASPHRYAGPSAHDHHATRTHAQHAFGRTHSHGSAPSRSHHRVFGGRASPATHAAGRAPMGGGRHGGERRTH